MGEVIPGHAIARQHRFDRGRRDRLATGHRARLYHRRPSGTFASIAPALLAIVGLMGWSSGNVALADPAPSEDQHITDERPWTAGVTAEQKARANELLTTGNELLVQNKYAQALQRYEEAAKVWDHPAIRANMVVCFINLGRPLEAYENALLALRYGDGPYAKREIYVETLNYAKRLEQQVVKLEIQCDESGAFVTLDGQASMTCPGIRRHLLLAGTHQIVARKKGFLTVTSELTFSPGASREVGVRLVRLEDAAVTVRRWATWKPWAVAAGGAGLILAAGALQLKAVADMEQSDSELDRVCPNGCDPEGPTVPPSVESLHSRAVLESQLAVGMAIAGTAVAITGLVCVYLNRPRTILPDESGFGPRIAPSITPTGAGLFLEGSF